MIGSVRKTRSSQFSLCLLALGGLSRRVVLKIFFFKMFPSEFKGTGRGWYEVITVLREALLWCRGPCELKPYEDGLAVFYLSGGARFAFGWCLEQMCRGLRDRFVHEVRYGLAGVDCDTDERAGREVLRFVVEWNTGDQEEIFVWLFEVDSLPPPTQW